MLEVHDAPTTIPSLVTTSKNVPDTTIAPADICPPQDQTPIAQKTRAWKYVQAFSSFQPPNDPEYIIDEVTMLRYILGIVGPIKNDVLKRTCRHMKLRLGGKKQDLVVRIASHQNLRPILLLLKTATEAIHKKWSAQALNRVQKISGTEYLAKCVNDTDPITMEDISDVPRQYLICLKDCGEKYYAFDIRGLVEYQKTNVAENRRYGRYRYRHHPTPPLTNPCNRQEFPPDEFARFSEFSRLSSCETVEIQEGARPGQDDPNTRPQQSSQSYFNNLMTNFANELRIVFSNNTTPQVSMDTITSRNEALFQHINSLGWYASDSYVSEATAGELSMTMRSLSRLSTRFNDIPPQRMAQIYNLSVERNLEHIRLFHRHITSMAFHRGSRRIMMFVINKIGTMLTQSTEDPELQQTGSIIFLSILANSIGSARQGLPFLAFDE